MFTSKGDERLSQSTLEVAKVHRRTKAITAASDDLHRMREVLKAREARRSRWLIDPREVVWVQYWDLFMLIVLLVVLFLTPFEAALLADRDWGLFAVNRFFDCVFGFDMAIHFFLAYNPSDAASVAWVVDLKQIRRHYLHGWFMIDLLAIIPFWIVPIAVSGSGMGVVNLSRAIRLFRLIKLSRILGASRLVKRYEMRMDITFASITFAKMIFGLIAWAHLQACVWAGLPDFEADGAHTWVDDLAAARGEEVSELNPWVRYVAAMHAQRESNSQSPDPACPAC
jgi:hypothetical protein